MQHLSGLSKFVRKKTSSVFQRSKACSVSKDNVLPPEVEPKQVLCLCLTDDSTFVYSESDGIVLLADTENFEVLKRWSFHSLEVTKLVYGPVIQHAFSASRDKSVIGWRTDRDRKSQVFLGHQLVVTGLTISPDNQLLCTGSRDNTVRLWDVSTSQCICCNQSSRNLVTDMQWAPKNNFVIQTSEDKSVRMWDSRTLELCSILGKKMHIQSSCSVSSDSNFCITTSAGFSSEGCEITLWDLRERRLVEEFRQHEQAVMAATFLPLKPELSKRSQHHFVSGSKDGMICLWNKDKLGCQDSCLLMGSGSVTSLDVTANGHRLLIGTRQRGVLGLEINSNYRLQLLSCVEPTKF